MSEPAKDPAKFWNRIADRYARKPVKDTASYERTLECTRKFLSPTDRVLELGCGTGSTALALAPCVAEITASDFSARMLEIGREKARAQGVQNVRFVQATPTDPALGSGPFDAVLAFNLLHLLEDLPGTVQRVRELLRPGGVFVSKTICLAEQGSVWRLVIPVLRALGVAPPVRFLKAAELETILADAGFEILETGFYPAPNRFLVARRADQDSSSRAASS